MARACVLLAALCLLRGAGLRAEKAASAAISLPKLDAAVASAATGPVSPLELQVALHRRGFSTGSIDGAPGGQTAAALRAFQRSAGIRETGVLDDDTRSRLALSTPALGTYVLTDADLKGLHPVPSTWLEKSTQAALGYANALELVAERSHADPRLIRQLNPKIDWTAVTAGSSLVVPSIEAVDVTGNPTQIVIELEAHQLEVIDDVGRVMAHFPVSIARMVEKRPVGALTVVVVIKDPDYTFDPEVFPESAEGRALGRRLRIPPGPNNPVGVVWIGLDRPGYGIHGTPDPEKVGHTESHGCFRLANWDALTLSTLVRNGMPVTVDP